MSDTMIQSIEKALGREPPVSQKEKKQREYVESVSEKYREKIAAGEQAMIQTSGQADAELSLFSETLAGEMTFDLGSGESHAVPAITLGLAVLLVIVSFVTFRLARRNRMMRESGYFNNEVIGKMAQKQETVLWFRKQSPNRKEYQKFVGDVQRLVDDYNDSGEGKIDLSEAWRRQ